VDSPSDRALESIAKRQAQRRRFNERLAALDPVTDLAPFRCECGLIACGAAIRLSTGEYTAVRSDPRWFAVHASHVLPEDRVVASHAGWVTVENAVSAAVDRDRGAAGTARVQQPHS
jgi:hypothetical protein